MKTIEKKSLDRVIAITREINSGECLYLDFLITDRILEAKHLARKAGVEWLSVLDLVDSILRYEGFQPDADNEVVYQVLKLLGWEVV